MRDLNQIEVLLVEDNPSDAEITLTALRRRNLADRVHHVRDGVEALAFIFGSGTYAGRHVECTPKVVLLDLKLPKVDGLEVLGRIKSDARTQPTPVVVLTSSDQERDVVECYRLGVNGYVVKPIEFDEFMERVGQVGAYWLRVNRAAR